MKHVDEVAGASTRICISEVVSSVRHQPTSGAPAPRLALRQKIDVAIAIAICLLSCALIAAAPLSATEFPGSRNQAAKNAFFVLDACMPFAALIVIAVSTRPSAEVVRFGTLFAYAVFVVGASAAAGYAFAPAIFVDGTRRAEWWRDRTTLAMSRVRIPESVLLVCVGLYAGCRCAVTGWRRRESEALSPAPPPAPEDLARHFARGLAYLQALSVAVIAMDVAIHGGAIAHPALCWAVAGTAALPALREALEAAGEGIPLGRGVYALLSVACAVAQFVPGFCLPLFRAFLVAIGRSDRAPWLDAVCGIPGAGGGQRYSECTLLSLATYVAVALSAFVSLYSGFVMIPRATEKKK